MSDKDKVSFTEGEEEEFHITDEDIDRELAALDEEHFPVDEAANTSSVTSSTVPSNSGRFAKLKQLKRKHWIIIVIVILLLLMVLLKIMGNKSSASNNFNQITPVSMPINASSTSAKPMQTDLTKTAKQPSNVITTVKTDQGEYKSDLSSIANNQGKLTQALQAIQEQNIQLTQQLKEMSSRVQTLETTFNQSSQAVEGLAQQVVQLQTSPQAGMKKTTGATPQFTPAPTAVADEPKYTVEAVVPQRAWLQTEDGSTITVMVGDNVPGFGAVVTIDPYSGNVTTSSGTVLKYAG